MPPISLLRAGSSGLPHAFTRGSDLLYCPGRTRRRSSRLSHCPPSPHGRRGLVFRGPPTIAQKMIRAAPPPICTPISRAARENRPDRHAAARSHKDRTAWLLACCVQPPLGGEARSRSPAAFCLDLSLPLRGATATLTRRSPLYAADRRRRERRPGRRCRAVSGAALKASAGRRRTTAAAAHIDPPSATRYPIWPDSRAGGLSEAGKRTED